MQTSDGAKLLEHKEDIIWKGNIGKYLLLPSFQWRPVQSPGPNPGTNSFTNMTDQISERNFVGRKKEVVHSPSLSPSSNEYPRQRQTVGGGFLPSTRTLMDRISRYFNSVRYNPGTNSFTNVADQISERNFAGRNKEVVHPPPLSPFNNEYPRQRQTVVGDFLPSTRTLTDRTSEGARILEHKENLLLPSLQWRPVRSPGSNPGTNSRTDMISTQISEKNFAGRKEFARPPPVPSFHNEYRQHKISIATNMATH
ncbi:hypothetical protein FXO37_05199 [Capsicum annuum]|nr:hypothetical protein FXO37_05199 [Capsicum annuum]